MRRVIGIVMIAVSIFIAISMIVLANVTFRTAPVQTAPSEFRWYVFKFGPDWRLFACDGILFFVGWLCVVIPRKSRSE